MVQGFTKFGHLLLTTLFTFFCVSTTAASKLLKCESTRFENDSASPSVFGEMHVANHRRFPLQCPCAYDKHGTCRQAPHMCVASTKSRYCKFKLKNMIVTAEGGLIFNDKNRTESCNFARFTHSSMCGGKEPMYHPNVYESLGTMYEAATGPFYSKSKGILKNNTAVYDVVVPLRMPYDGKFNHMSFQMAPLIGAVMEFHGLLPDITWHASKVTAAYLQLLGIPSSRIASQTTILAKTVLLPWIPNWCPMINAPYFGIAKNTFKLATNKLLTQTFPADYDSPRNRLAFSKLIMNRNASQVAAELHTKELAVRYVVYLSRNISTMSRQVVNEPELLAAIEENLDQRYKLVVLRSVSGSSSPRLLHKAWQNYAKVVSHARVLIGPHGGGLNNLMWAPEDCDVIEFNEYPDDLRYNASASLTVVRRVFLNAFWAKGGSGRFWIVPPSMTQANLSFYFTSKMRVAPRDVLQVLQQIDFVTANKTRHSSNSDKQPLPPLLRPNITLDRYPEEIFGYFPSDPPSLLKPKRRANRTAGTLSHHSKMEAEFIKNITQNHEMAEEATVLAAAAATAAKMSKGGEKKKSLLHVLAEKISGVGGGESGDGGGSGGNEGVKASQAGKGSNARISNGAVWSRGRGKRKSVGKDNDVEVDVEVGKNNEVAVEKLKKLKEAAQNCMLDSGHRVICPE